MMQSHRRLQLLIAVVVSCAVGTRAFSSLSYPTHQRYGLLRNSHRVQPHAPNRFHIAKITVVKVSWDPFLLDAQVATTSLANSLFRFSGSVPLWQAFGINAVLFAALQKKLFQMLTPAGFLHSMALGTGLWATLGWRGWTLCVAYLFLGQAVTKVRFAEKEKLGIAEKRGGRRGPENVWGSAATGLLCATCASYGQPLFGIPSQLFLLGYVSSLATKLADTFASEIGKAYGKTTFLITTFERVPPGTEGAVSAEGTAAALFGGLLLPLYGLSIGLIGVHAVPIATFASFFATNVESILGATLQDKEGLSWVTNEVINFINTLIGAVVAIGLGVMLLGSG